MRLARINEQVLKQMRNMKLNVDLDQIKNEVIYKKINNVNKWYTKIIGLDEVKLYQDRVVALQEKLLAAQERRREIGQELVEVRRKSNELQEQIHKVKRQEDLTRFLDLMRDETEVLKQEQNISRMFTDCDREEREIFTAFTNAIRDSHEKQRAQLEYTKYLGLILSIAGSFLVFVYSTLRKEDLKRFILQNTTNLSSSTVPALVRLQDKQDQLTTVVNKLRDDNGKLLTIVNSIQDEVRNYSSAFSGIKNSLNGNKLLTNWRGQRDDDNSAQSISAQKIVVVSVGALVGLIILKFIS